MSRSPGACACTVEENIATHLWLCSSKGLLFSVKFLSSDTLKNMTVEFDRKSSSRSEERKTSEPDGHQLVRGGVQALIVFNLASVKKSEFGYMHPVNCILVLFQLQATSQEQS